MPRPRKISEEDVVEAVAALLARQGPGALTFAAASEATGLSPATLVQRYGNRDALMQAALVWMWDQLDLETAAADAAHPVDAEGAVALLVRLSTGYGSGDDAGQGLLLLREDFRDPILRARGAAWQAALGQALGRRLSNDPAQQKRLGTLMASQWQGAVLWWGFSREGTLRSYLRHELRDWLHAIGH
ncbi:MAG: TetR/AcrR family transcriptional regulator [Devosia sp.]